MKNEHWQRSCEINARYFGGDPTQPVCARVYAHPPALWRLIFLGAMVLYFRERGHCRRIWAEWVADQQEAQP
ncbi:hypothetical protein [Paracoccus sp. SY]|uniref:hypothetical protein n=1 Tax=Paracoccus sp. SY TaxID=1330255 RepID=UPI000CD2EE30|nr:hypothetical protein [Paracoccus sp. SY]